MYYKDRANMIYIINLAPDPFETEKLQGFGGGVFTLVRVGGPDHSDIVGGSPTASATQWEARIVVLRLTVVVQHWRVVDGDSDRSEAKLYKAA